MDTLTALLLGPRNCTAVTGLTWQTARREARKLGIAEIRITNRKVALPAREFVDALRARAGRAGAAAPVDELDAARRAMGLERAR